MTRTRQHALRPEFDDLEGRHLLSLSPSPLPETSSWAPAITVFNGRLYMAWAGTDAAHHLNIESSPDGVNFDSTTKLITQETTSAAPALATFYAYPTHVPYLAVAWTGTDNPHHLNVAISPDGRTWFKNTLATNNYTSAGDGPALAPFGDNSGGFYGLAIAYTGTDGQVDLVYSYFTPYNGLTFGGPHPLGAATHTQVSPALAEASDGTLEVAWTTDDTDNIDWGLIPGGAGEITYSTVAPVHPQGGVLDAPGLVYVSYKKRLEFFWGDYLSAIGGNMLKISDSYVTVSSDNWSQFGPSGAVWPPDGTSSPGHEIAWTGEDGHLYFDKFVFDGY